MAELILDGIKIRLRFDFFAALAFMTALSGGNISSLALLCCILHELGHLAVMRAVGAKPSAILFYGAGIMITPAHGKLIGIIREAAVLSAGCAVNFLLAAAGFLAGESGRTFAAINLLLGCFNLLPCGMLDGGRLLKLFLESRFSMRTAYNICRAAGCAAAVIFPAAAFVSGVRNITVWFSAAMMIVSSLMV